MGMYQDISRLVLYRDFGRDSILIRTAEIVGQLESGTGDRDHLADAFCGEARRLLELSMEYSYSGNLWQDYLSYLLITNENPFSLACEKTGAPESSIRDFAENDFRIFSRLYAFDFSGIGEELGISWLPGLQDYRAPREQRHVISRGISEMVGNLTRFISGAVKDAETDTEAAEEMYGILTRFYSHYGVGKFGLNKAFRVVHPAGGGPEIVPITSTSEVRLDDLVGYELQKQELLENTEAFVSGRKANNCLLYGDSGTGKSTSIKAIINEFYDRGLRMVEIYKHQFQDLSAVISMLKNRNYRFIIYMDDLSFEDFETEYKYLKAVIEGGLETRPENVLIYATSNRRHLIRETWKDRSDLESDLHHSDTVEEKLSLVSRFGVTIRYISPEKKEYNQIVLELARRHPEIKLSDAELIQNANKWEISHGGMTGRTAQQFIDALLGRENAEKAGKKEEKA